MKRQLFALLGALAMVFMVIFGGCQPAEVSVTDTADSEIYVPSGAEQLDGSEEARSACILSGNIVVYLDGRDLDGWGSDFCVEDGQAWWNQVTLNGDCNELDAAIHPGATETCDGVDQDCDGTVDDGVNATTWFIDADGDTFGLLATTKSSCSQPSGYVSNSSDCNDASAAIKPSATEACNSVDDNCNGSVDESGGAWYQDLDADLFGNASVKSTVCAQPSGYVSNNTDCNDTDATISPADAEVCNAKDDDCSGGVDNGLTTQTFYRNADGDGYGLTASSTVACAAPAGYTSASGDCNDVVATIYPGATETCNGVDDDCDGSVDEVGGTVWYRDVDGDGYGLSTSNVMACSAPAGYVALSGDCNDGSTAIKPSATETCNGVDDDCDNSIDEGATPVNWYRDVDGDGYGAGAATVQCLAPTGFVNNNSDCNDGLGTIKPTATEACDGVDNDCDGFLDEGLSTQTYYRDGDGDGYGGTLYSSVASCARPSGYQSTNTDCNDASGSVHPGATEVANDGIDQDCSGGDLITSGDVSYTVTVTLVSAYSLTAVTGYGDNVSNRANPSVSDPYWETHGAITASGTGSYSFNVMGTHNDVVELQGNIASNPAHWCFENGPAYATVKVNGVLVSATVSLVDGGYNGRIVLP